MNCKLGRLVMWLIDLRTATLWHPESPGGKVEVTRSRIGRWFKPVAFATLTEAMKAGIIWKPYNVSLHALRKPRPARVPKSRARLGWLSSVVSGNG